MLRRIGAMSTLAGKRLSEANGEPAAKRFKADYCETIAFLVGRDEKKFVLHKATACAKLPLFQRACSANKWAEGQDMVRFPTKDPEAFSVVAHWMYTKELDFTDMVTGDHYGRSESVTTSYRALCTVWALAYDLGSVEMCNTLVDATLLKYQEEYIKTVADSTLNYAWTLLPNGSGLKRLLTDMAVTMLPMGDVRECVKDWPRELLTNVIERLCTSQPRQDSNPLEQPVDYYHDHVGDGSKG